MGMNRKTNDASIREVLHEMIEAFKLGGKLDQTRLRKLWPELMGEAIARHTQDLHVRQGKLYVHILAPALRQELSYGREKIRKIVNDALGEERIKEVLIR